MSGRIYDIGTKATCNVCGADCWLSEERNFNGARCKNIKCNSHDVTYSNFYSWTVQAMAENDDVISGDNDIKININHTDRDIDTETKFGSDAMEMKKNLYKNYKDKEK